MVSRTYQTNLILGILFICLTAASLGYFIQGGAGWIIFPLSVLLLIEVILLVNHLDTVNRKISSFFAAMQNEDTAIQLPEQSNKGIIRDIYRNLNLVADRFREIKIESECREQLFLAMIEHSSTGFISIDEHGDFEIMNETARTLLNVTYTSNIHRIESDYPELCRILMEIGPRQVRSCKIETHTQSTIVQVSASSLKFRDKELKLISFLDIKKEIELKELESWQKLIRIMNHEIMNSIAPITSVSKSLMKMYLNESRPISRDEIDDKRIRDTINGLEVIESMSSGLRHFVDNYRKLSQIPTPVLKTIRLDQWTEYLKTVGREIAANEKITVFVQSGCKEFKGDEKLLNQVMINLIKNAAEAPADEGYREIILNFEKTVRNSILITVHNNGRPIEPEAMDKIFIPFFTTKEKGAGIGLFLSRQIISLHQGTISVVSNPAEGTTFIIEI